MGPIQTVDEFLGLLIRRRLLIAVIVLFGMIVSVMLALARAPLFETAAIIQIEVPRVAAGDSAADTRIPRMLQSIEQRLTTRDNMIAMIERHGLFSDAPGMSVEDKVYALRGAVRFENVPSAAQSAFGDVASVAALIVVVQLADGDLAARVANDFAQNILDLSTAGQAARTRETLAFFMQEEARISSEITALEAELAAFKNLNSAALPGSRDFRQDEVSTIETELRQIDQSILAVTGQKTALEAKERLREVDRREIDALSSRLVVLNSQRAALEDKKRQVLDRVALTPEIERELSNFDRRLQQLQAQYEVTTTRKAEAETALRLEEQRHSEHFSLLERAIVPEYPLSAKRKQVAVAGTIGSILLALGVAFGLDMMNPVIRTSGQMKRELDILPVIVIPELDIKRRPTAQDAPVHRWSVAGRRKKRPSDRQTAT